MSFQRICWNHWLHQFLITTRRKRQRLPPLIILKYPEKHHRLLPLPPGKRALFRLLRGTSCRPKRIFCQVWVKVAMNQKVATKNLKVRNLYRWSHTVIKSVDIPHCSDFQDMLFVNHWSKRKMHSIKTLRSIVLNVLPFFHQIMLIVSIAFCTEVYRNIKRYPSRRRRISPKSIIPLTPSKSNAKSPNIDSNKNNNAASRSPNR